MDHSTTNHIGRATSRYDGPAKVTGTAGYAADSVIAGLAHAVAVPSAVSTGRITALKIDEASSVAGVIAILSHMNCPEVATDDKSYQDQVAPPGAPFRPFQDDRVRFWGQPIAMVIAEDFETARYAASLVTAEYDGALPTTDFEAARAQSYEPPKKRAGQTGPAKARGDADKAFDESAVRVGAAFHSAPAHHSPMEMHASTAIWTGEDSITVHDKTQGAHNCQAYVAKVFGYDKEKVTIEAPYMGGGFGIGLRPQYQLFLAVLAARATRRSVQLMLTRQQMFTFGHRPETSQTVRYGAAGDGTLAAVEHEAIGATSNFEDYQENVVNWSEQLYRSPNAKYGYEITKLDIYTPADMRAPGGTLGVYAIEAAMDELAHRVGMDPIALRLTNYSDEDQAAGKPFSTKELRACFEQGAARFGWDRRKAEPRSTRKGHELVGLGMSAGIWEANMMQCAASIKLLADGRVKVSSGMSDIGTGTYTIVSQIVAETLCLPLDRVSVKLGDSRLPKSPVEGGSWGAASVGNAVADAAQKFKQAIVDQVRGLNESPLSGVRLDDVRFQDGAVIAIQDESRRMSFADIARSSKDELKADGSSVPGLLDKAKALTGIKKYSSFTHSAVFAEVAVDEDFGTIRVDRIVIAVDAGRILNPKTARSQILGGVVWGISQALHEESLFDHSYGRIMNHSFAEYHIPVNADIHDIDVIFVETPDTEMNKLGVKGLGEIGIVGTSAAIANAVFNATGKRIRSLPMTIEKVLADDHNPARAA